MAKGGKPANGDMVLGGRHLIGIFILLVVLFGVVFTLGYVLGRNQYDVQLRAAASTVPSQPEKTPEKPAVAEASKPAATSDTPPVTPAADFDFYHVAEPAKTPEVVPLQPNLPVAASASAKSASSSGRTVAAGRTVPTPEPFVPAAGSEPSPGAIAKSLRAPQIPHGATVLQVAALGRQTDATALAAALQQKKFPAFVLTPTTDHFYRVQVGPYTDAQSANQARQKLESQGFKSIVKR